MRAFLAFDLDPAFVEAVAGLQASLRAHEKGRRPRWCAPETMHVTARFFGSVADPAPVAALVAPFARLAHGEPHVRATRIDAFPDTRRARVLVLPIEDDGTLAAIAKEAEAAAVALGFAAEERAYRPHLTLARLKEPRDVRDLAAMAVAIEGRAIALTLYESKTLPTGPTYTPVARSPLE